METWLALLACTVLRVENGPPGAPTIVNAVSLPGGERTVLGAAHHRVNAIGYAAGQGVAYGLAGDHAVTIGRGGALRDLGPVPGPDWGPLLPPTAATVAADRWYLLDHDTLYTVDIDPDGPAYLETAGSLALRPGHAATRVDDVDIDPETGLLYGVAAGHHTSTVVTIDPRGGQVATLPGPHLPPGTAYGAVSVGLDDALYVTANHVRGHSRLYRVPLDGAGDVRELAQGPPLASSDATGCLARPQPPPSPGPTTTTSTTPPVTTGPTTHRSTTPPPDTPATTTIPATTTTTPPATTPPATTAEPPGRAPPPRPPASGAAVAPPPAPPSEQASATDVTATERKRRWALTLLVLLVGAGAAARKLARH